MLPIYALLGLDRFHVKVSHKIFQSSRIRHRIAHGINLFADERQCVLRQVNLLFRLVLVLLNPIFHRVGVTTELVQPLKHLFEENRLGLLLHHYLHESVGVVAKFDLLRCVVGRFVIVYQFGEDAIRIANVLNLPSLRVENMETLWFVEVAEGDLVLRAKVVDVALAVFTVKVTAIDRLVLGQQAGVHTFVVFNTPKNLIANEFKVAHEDRARAGGDEVKAFLFVVLGDPRDESDVPVNDPGLVVNPPVGTDLGKLKQFTDGIDLIRVLVVYIVVAQHDVHVSAHVKQGLHEPFPNRVERLKVDVLAAIHQVAQVNDVRDAVLGKVGKEHLFVELEEMFQKDG